MGTESRAPLRLGGPGPLTLAAALAAALALVALGVYLLVAQRSQPTGLAALEGSAVDRATLPASVPLRDVAGQLVVEARFGEAADSVPLILDTGAPTSISFDLADRVAGHPVGEIAQAAVDGKVVPRDIVTVATLHLGAAAFREVGAVRMSLALDDPLGCVSRHGLMGASLMRDAVWQIDYAAGELTIASGIDGLDHVAGAIALGFTPETEASPSPVVDIGLGEGRLSFLVDTGSDGWLAAHPEDLAEVGAPADPEGPAYWTRASTITGAFLARVLYGAADVRLGDRLLGHLPVATLEALPRGLGNMGNAFLRHFVVTIDWPGRRLYLDPVGSPPRPRVPALAGLGWGGGEIVVASFVEGAAAQEAGLAIGLPVLALDGRDLTGATLEDACALIVGRRPGSFDMTVLGGRTVHVAPVADFFAPLSAAR